MAIEDPEPSFEEKWRRRIEAATASAITLAGLLWLQVKVLPANVWIGLGVAPLVSFGAFQLVARVATGRGFSFRLDPFARRPEEVLDLIFTVGFLLTVMVGCYVIWDS